jgi:hypothetical protein
MYIHKCDNYKCRERLLSKTNLAMCNMKPTVFRSFFVVVVVAIDMVVVKI